MALPRLTGLARSKVEQRLQSLPASSSKTTKSFQRIPRVSFSLAFQKWMKDVAALPVEQQVELIRKKLMELNPGFDGKIESWMDNGVVIGMRFVTDNVTDISPVRGLAGLKKLFCNASGDRKGRLADLSPLKGMLLTELDCGGGLITDLSPLVGMPLTELRCGHTQLADLAPIAGMNLTLLWCDNTNVSNLSPLKGMALRYLNCNSTTVQDLAPLKGMPLTDLNIWGTSVSDLSPLSQAPLTLLNCNVTKVSNLSPLRGRPLRTLYCNTTGVSDLSPLHDCKQLTTLTVVDNRITAAGVAALKKALPNCRIEWDDPARR